MAPSVSAWEIQAAMLVGRNLPSQMWVVMPTLASACCMPEPKAARIGTESPIGMYQTVLPLSELTPLIDCWAGRLVTSPLYWDTSALAEVSSLLEPDPDPEPELLVEEPPPLLHAAAAKVADAAMMEQIKAAEKKHVVGEDEAKTWSDEVQKLTDAYIKRIDEALVEKEREIKQV